MSMYQLTVGGAFALVILGCLAGEQKSKHPIHGLFVIVIIVMITLAFWKDIVWLYDVIGAMK